MVNLQQPRRIALVKFSGGYARRYPRTNRHQFENAGQSDCPIQPPLAIRLEFPHFDEIL